MPSSGDRFGDFVLRRELGRGAMGVVWEARQQSLGRDVALKILNESVGADPVWVARFQAEAAQAARLSHPGILPVYAVGETAGLHWFAMEKVSGEDLAKRLSSRGPFPYDEAARYVRDTARALAHAHERGVIHRDIKPANLMLREDGRIAVTDFGLVKELGSGALTTTGLLVGTPYYMSPELVGGKPGEVGPRSDVYGLGVTLYELLTGTPPFVAESAVALLRQISETEPEPPGKRRPGLPRDLETITLICLAKRPERRYPSAEALAKDLELFLAHEPIASRRPGLGERIGRWAARHRLAVTVAALALVALIGVTLFFTQRMASQEAEYREQIERLLREADLLAESGEHEKADEVEAKLLELAQQGPQAAQQVQQGFAQNLVDDLRSGRPVSPEQRRRVAGWSKEAPARLKLEADVPGVEVEGLALADRDAQTMEPIVLDGRELPAGLWRFQAKAPGRLPTIVTVLAAPGAHGTLRLSLPPESEDTDGMRSYGGAWFAREAAGAPGEGFDQLLAPYLLDEERVTVADYAEFLGEAPEAERAALTPAGWRAGRPPNRLQPDSPILGLTRVQAETYALAQGKRLPLDHELMNASAPARLGEVMREARSAARTKTRGIGGPREFAAELKAALAEAGELIEKNEGLRGWDGRPEMAVGGRGAREGLEAPWPRIDAPPGEEAPAAAVPAAPAPKRAPSIASRPDPSETPRNPRDLFEALPPGLRLAR